MIDVEELARYLPEAVWFRHNPFGVHGVAHAARVLVWTDILARSIAGPTAIDRDELRWAASCHDVGRVDDGIDRYHPARSAAWVRASLKGRRPQGVEGVDLERVANLCRWHAERDHAVPSLSLELLILKDADALDRARLGDLDTRRLRLAHSHHLVGLAVRLYRRRARARRRPRPRFW